MTIRHCALAALLAACSPSPRQQPPATPVPTTAAAAPSTDIYLYRLNRVLPWGTRLVNITNRRGYDNQPSWDGQSILYTSIRDGQADIYRFHDDLHERITYTSESEYSPAITPDGKAISVVRVERDSTQRLWRFPLKEGEPAVVLPDVKPVGYYAWLDSTRLALFVLGSPNTLQIADTRTGSVRVVVSDIGRSLQRVPESMRASFVQRVDSQWVLRTVHPVPNARGNFDIQTIGILPAGAEYVAWRSPTELYTGAETRIYRLRLPSRRWEQVAELGGLQRISRIAISPDGRTLAIVAEEP